MIELERYKFRYYIKEHLTGTQEGFSSVGDEDLLVRRPDLEQVQRVPDSVNLELIGLNGIAVKNGDGALQLRILEITQ